ncbi:MAG: hypothetical protein C5B51_00185 [Terriglobia bacterium]|nr:MAG: hypothetical protein C5B51_00185 [Terriglobia bacterium]
MRMQLQRRIEKLSAIFKPANARRFTLEEACRLMWRMDEAGFRRLAEGNGYRTFVAMFEMEDAAKQTAQST